MINPVEDIVVVAPLPPRSTIEMLRPDVFMRGRVLAVGPGLMIRGKLLVPDVKVNDTVHLAPGKSIDCVFDQKKVWITRERELLAVEDPT